MKNINIQYKELLFDILENGYEYTDPKRDVKCKQIDDAHIRIDLREGFPAINLKKLWWKGVVGELLWFLSGNTNIKPLLDNGINIWNKDAFNWFRGDEDLDNLKINTVEKYIAEVKKNSNNLAFDGNLGRIYGAQWRNWTEYYVEKFNGGNPKIVHRTIDQISNLITNLKEQPMSRRHIVNAWNPAELDNMALPPCHWSFEIIVRPINHKCDCSESEAIYCGSKCQQKYGFTLKWHQRSVDTYLGLPFNIASYALLAHIIGKLTNMIPMNLVGDLSNVHLYENSWSAARELLKRDPMKYDLPKLGMTENVHNFDSKLTLDELLNGWNISDFSLSNYQSYDNIPVEMLAPNG